MPMISDLDGYVKYAQQQKGTLKCPQYTFTDSTGTKKTIAEKTVNAYYNDVGPSGNANLADKGALVLVGTYDKPVEIKGPVVVDSDVIISGYIKGQGVIYSGRNIHVLDNVYYKNGPDWSSVNNKNGSGTVSTVTQNNKDKDLVCFIAKGNVVIGNCSSTDWYNSIKKYISNDEAIYNTSQHDCDPSDKNIGYDTKFGGDYTSVEKTGTHLKVSSEPDYVWGSDGHRLKDSYGNYIKKLKNRNDRRYYQTVCDDAILGTFNKSNPNHLDGVFYNNHCIMGTVGNNSKNNMTIFGSLVCRNEALLVTTQGKMMFNWDNRLREGSPSHVAGLPLPRGLQTPHTYSWQEVPDEMNPIYQGQKSARDALGI